MKKPNPLLFICLSFMLVAGSCEKDNQKYFSFDDKQLKEQYYPEEKMVVALKNPEAKTIDSIVYYLNDANSGSKKGNATLVVPLAGKKLGYQNLKALVYFEGKAEPEEVQSRIEVISSVVPKIINYEIVNTYPHDEKAFVEGLEFYRDTLIESTGQKGASYFRKFDYRTGYAYKQVNLEPQYFGEGITVIGDKLFQLTWEDQTGFIYNVNTMQREKTFEYDKKVEGWGMTNDGSKIYRSDGTEKIWVMDPETQKTIDYMNVYSGTDKIKKLNELEWIKGKIFGNIWYKDAVAVIDPATGSVEAVIDFSNLRKQLKSPNAEVLNGIAYNPKSQTIFVTGKYWDKLFEIRLK